MALCLSLMSWAMPAYSATEPLTAQVETDPECLLSAPGEMSFFRFTLKNTLDEPYTAEKLTLSGDVLSEPKLISEQVTIPGNDVLEFTLENVFIGEGVFDRPLAFTLSWQLFTYIAEDVNRENPIVTDHSLSVSATVERFIEPVLTLSVATDTPLVREGEGFSVTYTLKNDTKFDMTNITLQDAGSGLVGIPLEKDTLLAGQQMSVSAELTMKEGGLTLQPLAKYTVRGLESEVKLETAFTVAALKTEVQMEVEQYPATKEGTLFQITLTNAGTHPVTNLVLTDEIGTRIGEVPSLNAGESRTLSCTVPSAVAAGQLRNISFTAKGKDALGADCTVHSPQSYPVLPFVSSDQVDIRLSVVLRDHAQLGDGSWQLKVLFEIENRSQVPITQAVITEGDYYKGVVNEYETLSTGTTSFEKELVLPEGTRSLTFVLTAQDPAQTQYATVPMSLDLSSLMAPQATAQPQIRPGTTIDTTGTIYDTERYATLFRRVTVAALVLMGLFLLLSILFYVAEENVLEQLPALREDPVSGRLVKREDREDIDPVHAQFGYTRPIRLRYGQGMETEEQRAPKQNPEGDTAAFGPVPQREAEAEGDTAVFAPKGDEGTKAFRRPQRGVLLSNDGTRAFAPVHPQEKAQPQTNQPRLIEQKKQPRLQRENKLEILRF